MPNPQRISTIGRVRPKATAESQGRVDRARTLQYDVTCRGLWHEVWNWKMAFQIRSPSGTARNYGHRRPFWRTSQDDAAPGRVDNGVTFLRTGLDGGRERLIEARHHSVSATELCTVIGDTEPGSRRHHRASARGLAGLGVDNVHGRDRRAGSADHGRQRGALRRGDRPGRASAPVGRAAATSRCSSPFASRTAAHSPSCAPSPAASASTSRSISRRR